MQRISLPKTLTKSDIKVFSERGFTLIEIMVVLGILSALIAVGLPRLNRNNNNIKQVSRQMAVLGKEIRNQSRLKNMTHRLVIKMTGKEDSYWVEAAGGAVLAIANNNETISDEESEQDAKDEQSKPSPFQKSEKFFKDDRKLPGELLFKSVESQSQKEVITEGLAYIYFTPEGMIEKSAIQIGKGEMIWTLIYNPLTGQADIVDKPISLKDIPKL